MRLALGQVQQVQHPLLGAGEVTGAMELGPYPDSQVAQTIDLMRERVREDAANPEFQAYAARVLGGTTGMDAATLAWQHVKGVVRFHRDEELGGGLSDDTVEFIIRPREMAKFVERGQACGDCDDFSMYLACLLETAGVPCAFVTVAADERAPGQYSHVYVRAYPENAEAIALDASHGAYPGWEVPNAFGKIREWPVKGDGTTCLLMLVGGIAGAWYFMQGVG